MIIMKLKKRADFYCLIGLIGIGITCCFPFLICITLDNVSWLKRTTSGLGFIITGTLLCLFSFFMSCSFISHANRLYKYNYKHSSEDRPKD